MSTHIGNGAHSEMKRHPNYIWEQLAEDRLAAGFIVDGIHLGASFLKVALRAKTPARAVLVTDASMPALAEPGPYMLGEVEVELTTDGRVVLRGGDRLAMQVQVGALATHYAGQILDHISRREWLAGFERGAGIFAAAAGDAGVKLDQLPRKHRAGKTHIEALDAAAVMAAQGRSECPTGHAVGAQSMQDRRGKARA